MMINKYKFSDIVIGEEGLLKGPFGSDLKRSLYVPKSDDTYKVYLQENILKQDNSVGTHYISKDYYDKSMYRYAVKENDFVVTCDGTLGEIFQLKNLTEKGIISSSLLRITLNNDLIDYDFFYYFFKQKMKKALITSANNSVLKHLPGLGFIRNFEIEIPDLPTQKKIANVLSCIDDKIVLNNKTNTELENMAKTIYDYWFTQFDFPDKNGHPYKTSGGQMVYNETLKREIPAGWEVGKLSEIANITMGQSPDGESYNEDGNGTIFYQGSTDFGNRSPSIRVYTTAPTRFAKKNDILMSVRAPVGTLNIANTDCCIGRGLAALNSKSNSISYLYCVMRNFQRQFEVLDSIGTTFGSITKDDLFGLQVIIPPQDIIENFCKIGNEIFKEQSRIDEENTELTKLRDYLLPLLMNGQIEVK